MLILLALCTAAVPAPATTICAADDVIAIVLAPEVKGTANKADAKWSATFPYGSIYGVSTCMDVPGTTDLAIAELRSNDGIVATGDERKGKYCWCRMTHPRTSGWAFQYAGASIDSCGNNCTGYRANQMLNAVEARAAIFKLFDN